MQRLDPAACIKKYIDPRVATGSLILVARNVTSQQFNGSSLLDGWVSSWRGWPLSVNWICDAYQSEDPMKWRLCDWRWAEEFSEHWRLRYSPSEFTAEIDHCLVGDEADNTERCGLHYSAHIWGISCGCTLVECLLVLSVWLRDRRDVKTHRDKKKSRTMVTIGDAIQSFLEHPDSTYTAKRQDQTGTTTASGMNPVEVKKVPWQMVERVCWLRAVSGRTWVVSYI